MKNLKRSLILVLALAGLTGCSYQWRVADTGRDGSEVLEILNNIQNEANTMGDNGTASQEFFSLKDDPNSTIFFADAPGMLGPVVSILSFVDFSFLGSAYSFLSPMQIEAANVFFIDLPAAEGNWVGLLIDFKLMGNSNFEVPRIFTSKVPGTVQDGEYQVMVEDDFGVRLILRSLDVDSEGFLDGVIQLRVYDFDANGQEQYLGKISTLVGYGP